MVGESLKRVGYIYFLNKLYLVFLIWMTREILSPFLPGSYEGLHPNVLLDSLTHWDAGWFLRVAAQGYDYHSAPFFPMLPLLIRILTYITRDGVEAGFLIANTALFFACYFLYLMVDEEYGKETAMFSVFILLFFPTAVFLNSIYSEPLLLAFATGAFYYARRRRWTQAVLLGVCAALSRSVGVAIFFALLYMRYKESGNKITIKKMLPLLSIPASLSLFMLVLWLQAGDPLAFSHSLNTEYWGNRHFSYPGAGQLSNLSLFIADNQFYALFESIMAILFLLLIIISFKYIKDRALLIYMALAFLIPVSTVVDNLPLGMPRYILVVFPGYVALARWLKKNDLTGPYSIITVIVYSTICVLFIVGRWIS